MHRLTPLRFLLLLLLAFSLRALAAQAPSSAAQPDQKPDATNEVIQQVLQPLQEAMQGHDPGKLLAIFDKQQMPDYAQVRDQVTAFFRQYEAVQFRYQILQIEVEKGAGFVVLETDIAATPVNQAGVPVHRTTQMRLQIQQERNGWKVVEFKPGDFFAQ